MSNSKLTSTISTEDLLKALQAETKTPEVKQNPRKEESLLKFLETFNIEPGNYTIDKRIIYRLYRDYQKNHGTFKPFAAHRFYKVLASYLKPSKNVFYINQKSLDLSDRVMNMITPKKKTSTKILPLQIHFNNFVKKFDLKPGKSKNYIWVSIKTLFDLYDEWVFEIRKKRPLTFTQFSNFCRIYFPTFKKDSFSKSWVSLDDSIAETIKARNSYQNEKEESPE